MALHHGLTRTLLPVLRCDPRNLDPELHDSITTLFPATTYAGTVTALPSGSY